MSGGSYNYFCWNAPDKVSECADTLKEMAKQCHERAGVHPMEGDHAVDLATLQEVGDFLLALSLSCGGIARTLHTFTELTRTVEWWRSGDYSADQVIKAWRELSERKTT